MRIVTGVAVLAACSLTAACTAGSPPATPSSAVRSDPGPRAPSSAHARLSCSDPIAAMPAPTSPHSPILDVVALDTTSTLQVNAGSDEPHRLFAKTGLLVHVGRASTLTLPADWEGRASIAWGNHESEWTASLQIPACRPSTSADDQWLAFPGGFSVDVPSCVPLEVRAGNDLDTVNISVGARCPR
jgi:hypothetical protein